MNTKSQIFALVDAHGDPYPASYITAPSKEWLQARLDEYKKSLDAVIESLPKNYIYKRHSEYPSIPKTLLLYVQMDKYERCSMDKQECRISYRVRVVEFADWLFTVHADDVSSVTVNSFWID